MLPSRIYPTHGTFNQLRREINRLMENVGDYPQAFFGGRSFPALNLWEEGDDLCVEAEVPGLGMDQIDVHIAANELTIKGERQPMEGENLSYHRQERGTGTFSRSITLPLEVDPDRVRASLKSGVLTITLPKGAEARTRKISVQTE